MYNVLVEMCKCASNREILAVDLIKKLNCLLLGSLWKDDRAYLGYKNARQKEGGFKTSNNVILCQVAGWEEVRYKVYSLFLMNCGQIK